MHKSMIQKAVKEARLRAGIAKPSGTLTLHHSFATPLLEDGYDIRTVQENRDGDYLFRFACIG